MSRIRAGLALLLAAVLILLTDIRDPFVDGGADHE